jgi:hypothetical protein
LGGSGENRRFGTKLSVVKGAHRGDAPQMEIYSPVIRPITKRPAGAFFLESLSVLWYNICIQRTAFGRLFLLPATAGVFYGEKQ